MYGKLKNGELGIEKFQMRGAKMSKIKKKKNIL